MSASFGREQLGPLSFRTQMAIAAAIGLVARVLAFEWWYRGKPLMQDAPEYWLLGPRAAAGLGWTSPFTEGTNGIARQTANHPPLTSGWIALGRPVDVTEADRARLWMAVVVLLGVVRGGRNVEVPTVGEP